MSVVDWNRCEVRDGRKKYPASCHLCNAERWLVKRDARYVEFHQSPCYRCAQRIKGRLGWKAAVASKGEKWVVLHVQDRLRKHRTPQELIVEQWLADQGIPFRREELLATKERGRRQRCYLIDLWVWWAGEYRAIEINGGCHNTPQKQIKDKRKIRLLRRRKIKYIVLLNEIVDNGGYVDQLKQWFMED